MNRYNFIPNFTSIFKEDLKYYILFKRSNGYKYGKVTCAELLRIDRFFNEINLKEKKIDQNIIDLWLQKCSATNKKAHNLDIFRECLAFVNI